MPGPEPNAADDPQGWLKWYQEEQAAKGAGGTTTAKPETKGDTTTTTKPGANPTALPGTGNTPPGQTGTLSAFPEGTKFPAGATTRGIGPNGLWYEKMGDGTVKEGYPASQADRLAVGAGPVNQQGSKTTAAQVQANATARTPTPPTVATPPPPRAPVTGGILEKTSAILQNAGNAAGNAADQAGANASLRGAIGQSAAPGNQGPAIANAAGLPGTLSTAQGVTVPGMSQYNLSGYGVPSEGRQQLFDSSSLNTLRAGPPNGPEIQRGPGQRGPGQTGNAIGFGGSESDFKGGTSSIAPQTLFPTTTASVPGTYVKGEGNTNDSNRAYDVPFNIGPGGLSLASIGGSNVQLNSADKSTGTGVVLNAAPSSNFGAATGRSLTNDPALQAIETLQIMAAQNQGQSVGQMTDANRAQYSGNPAQGQGTYFSGSAPGPQATALPAPGAAPATGVPNDDNGDGVPDYAKGGTINFMPRRTGKTARPLGMASGGSVIAPVAPGATAPEIAAGGTPQAASYTSSPATGTLAGTGTISSASGTAAGPQITVGPQDATNPGTGSAYLSLTPEQQAQFQPFQTFAQQAASLQHARDNTDYIRGRAGLAKATEVPFFGQQGQADESLAPGQFTGYGSWINSLINNVGGKAQQLTDLGNPEAPDVINTKINTLTQQMTPYQAAQDLLTKIQGYGEVGDEETLNGELNALKAAAGPIATIADLQQQLVQLGDPLDTASMGQNVANLQATIDKYQDAYNRGDLNGDSGALAEYGYAVANLPGARAALGAALGHNSSIAQAKQAKQNLLTQAGLTEDQLGPKLAAYQTQIDAKTTQIKNAQAVKALNLQLGNLGLGQDAAGIASTLGGFQAQLTPLQQGLANATKAADIRGQLGNVLQTPLPKLPGFKKGGWIKTATANSHGQFAAKAKAAGKSTREFAAANQSAHGLLGKQARLAKTLMGFKRGGSMVTPERIIGIGATTGKPYFEVGEPHYPGGPDMAERLTKPASNKLKVTPLNRPSLPLGKGRKVAA